MRDVDVSKLRKWIGKAQQIGEPPAPNETTGNLTQPEGLRARSADRIVQLNLKIPASLKKRMKHLAARDEVSLALLLTRMLDLYEKEHGALPDFKKAQR